MALSPEDVQNKLFTTVRLREGYEQAEVDEFLDEVEAELTRLLKENDDLRTKLAEAGGDDAAAPVEAKPTKGAAATTPSPVKPQEVVVRKGDDIGAAAARVLNMAQRTADDVVSEAREEADKLLDDAKSTADHLTTDARVKADEVDRETRERTTALEQQLEEERRTALGSLQEEKSRLEREIETLRSFEREYRGRLRTFLEGQLSQLSSHGGDTPLAPSGGPDARATDDADGESSRSGAHALGTSGDTDQDADSYTGSDTGSGDSGSEEGQATGTQRGAGPRSALGRILEEEERNGDDDRR